MIRKRWSLLAGLACILVGRQIWALTEDPILPATAPQPTAPPAAIKQVRFEPPALARFDAISRRPVFAKSRRPAPPPKPSPPANAPPPKVVLTGIATAGESRSALIQGRDGSQMLLRMNDTIDGWRLIAIGERSITLERAGVRVETPIGDASSGASDGTDPALEGPRRSNNTPARRTSDGRGGLAPFEVDED